MEIVIKGKDRAVKAILKQAQNTKGVEASEIEIIKEEEVKKEVKTVTKKVAKKVEKKEVKAVAKK